MNRMSPTTVPPALTTDTGPRRPAITHGAGLQCAARCATATENTPAGRGCAALAMAGLSAARCFNASTAARAYPACGAAWMEGEAVDERSERTIAMRNRDHYLQAKAAFNANDMAECMRHYATGHQLHGRGVGPGREHIERFLAALRESWPDVEIVVDQAVAEGDWVAGRCTAAATHSQPVMGVAPTHRPVRASFWDMHRFDAEGRIVESWNLMDSLALMQQLGLLPAPR